MNYFLNEFASQGYNAATKARQDIADVLLSEELWTPIATERRCDEPGLAAKLGALRVNLKTWTEAVKIIGEGDCLLIQFPLAIYPKVALTSLPFISAIKSHGGKIVLLVHDLDNFRGEELPSSDDPYLKKADVIIVHNKRMEDLVSKVCNAKVIPLGVFDYLADGELPPVAGGIDIAGNLSPTKAGYLYCASKGLPGLPLNLYGANYDREAGRAEWYRGKFLPQELSRHMTGKFGLVWDGDSLDTCSGDYGEYLRINSPHKLSLYLSLGKPVFIWSQAAEATFVKENGVGVLVDSIFEVDEAYKGMSEDAYQLMRANALALSEKVRGGWFTKRAVTAALKALGMEGV